MTVLLASMHGFGIVSAIVAAACLAALTLAARDA